MSFLKVTVVHDGEEQCELVNTSHITRVFIDNRIHTIIELTGGYTLRIEEALEDLAKALHAWSSS